MIFGTESKFGKLFNQLRDVPHLDSPARVHARELVSCWTETKPGFVSVGGERAEDCSVVRIDEMDVLAVMCDRHKASIGGEGNLAVS